MIGRWPPWLPGRHARERGPMLRRGVPREPPHVGLAYEPTSSGLSLIKPGATRCGGRVSGPAASVQHASCKRCWTMDDDLERERVSLMARLVALERQHDALRDEPADSHVRAALSGPSQASSRCASVP